MSLLRPLPDSEYPDRGSFWNLRKDRKSGNSTPRLWPRALRQPLTSLREGMGRGLEPGQDLGGHSPREPRAAQMDAPPRRHSSPGQQQRAPQRRRQAAQASGPSAQPPFLAHPGWAGSAPEGFPVCQCLRCSPRPSPHHGGLSRSAGPSTPPSLTRAPVATRHLAGSTPGARLAWLGSRPGGAPREPGLSALHARQTPPHPEQVQETTKLLGFGGRVTVARTAARPPCNPVLTGL